MNRRILVVSTTTELDRATVDLAGRMARGLNGLIEFFYVFDPAEHEGQLLTANMRETADVRAWLTSLHPLDPAIPFEHAFVVGDLVEKTLERANTTDVALVILEQRAQSRWKRFFRANIAQRLVQQLPCPLLVSGPQTLSNDSIPALDATPSDTRTKLDILNVVVDARARALVNWMDNAARSAAFVAQSETLAAALWLDDCPSRLEKSVKSTVTLELNEQCTALHATGWMLQSENVSLQGGDIAVPPEAPFQEFYARLERDGQATSLPFLNAPDDTLLIVAGAIVQSGDRKGTVVFAFDPHDEFLRILEQPGPYATLETYAFDREGMMLSNSRFTRHLHSAGLLDQHLNETPFHLRVAEPSLGPREFWPLTHMALSAVHAGDGFDADGYPDYRGRPVIGAWRWIESLQFGVVAEVDRDEASMGDARSRDD